MDDCSIIWHINFYYYAPCVPQIWLRTDHNWRFSPFNPIVNLGYILASFIISRCFKYGLVQVNYLCGGVRLKFQNCIKILCMSLFQRCEVFRFTSWPCILSQHILSIFSNNFLLHNLYLMKCLSLKHRGLLEMKHINRDKEAACSFFS